MRKTLWSAVIGCLLCPGVATAAPQQLDAEDPPSATAPLTSFEGELRVTPCDTMEFGDGSTTVAEATVCEWLYVYNPALDGDPGRDYGIIWLQATAESFDEDTCVYGLTAGASESDMIVHSVLPDSSGKVRRREPRTVEMRTDAQEHGLLEASVAQDLIAVPGRITLDRSKAGLEARWEGRTRNKVALIVALEVSWDPTQFVFSGGRGIGMGVGACEPETIMVEQGGENS